MFDPNDDFVQVMDGLAPVTVLRAGSSATTAVAHALRQAIRTRASDGAQRRDAPGDVIWHLPAAELPEPPRPGDLILDAQGRRWTVLDVRQATLDHRWRCVARDVVVQFRLDQQVDIEKATCTKSAGGADVATWQPWRTGLAARIRPVEAAIEPNHERDQRVAKFKILLAEDVLLEPSHRIKGPDAAFYTILGYRYSAVGTPMEVDAVQTD